MFLKLELGNILAKAFTRSLKINKREKHANNEKGKLSESLRRIYSSSVSWFL